jgi:hypothetical protein
MLWFVVRTIRNYVVSGPRSADVVARQVIACGAMAYMLLAVTGPSIGPSMSSAMSGMSMAGSGSSAFSALSSPALRLIVIVVIVGLCAWTLARQREHSVATGPVLGVGCQLAVNATTIYMLIVM